MKITDIDDKFCGEFATYLAHYATVRDQGKELLSLQHAQGLFSNLKYFVKVKWSNERIPPCMEAGKWKRYMSSIREVKVAQAREQGVSIVKPHKKAEPKEWNAVQVVCFWSGTMEGAYMSHFNNGMIAHVGR